MPPVQSLDEILAQLEPAYGASRGLYNQQLSALPGQETAAVGGLETAKTNAFTDINRGANSKGLAFSGIPIEEQTRYTGEKYLPALAAVKKNTQDQTFSLQQALAGLEADKYKRGLDTRSEQQKRLDAYQEAERNRAFQMQMQREQIAASDRNAAASRSASAAGSTDLRIVHNAQGGWDVLENGKKSNSFDLNGYARASGANIVDLLKNGDKQDRQAAQWYEDKIKKYGSADQAKYLDELRRDRGTAFYLGG